MDALKKKIEESKAVLVIIDPVVAYLEKRINSWNDQDVRRAMAVLSQLAEQTGAAIVLIRHLNKKEDVKNKIYRGGGSIALIGGGSFRSTCSARFPRFQLACSLLQQS